MKEQHHTYCGIILLAAGESSRLGRPKQLLVYKGLTLLQRMLSVAGESMAGPIVMVLGANAEMLQSQLEGNKARIFVNTNWEEGIGSSIRLGVSEIRKLDKDIDAVILMLCDQPFVHPVLLNNLIEAYEKTGKPIITCNYGETFGPPTFFHKTMFPALLQLEGDVGARSILKRHIDQVETIDFPEGDLDIDTQEDYEVLIKMNSEE